VLILVAVKVRIDRGDDRIDHDELRVNLADQTAKLLGDVAGQADGLADLGGDVQLVDPARVGPSRLGARPKISAAVSS